MTTVTHLTQEAYLSSKDHTLARLIEAYGPCPLIAERGDPIYALFTAIIAQQLSASAARRIRARFVDHLGEDTGAWVARLLETPEEQLRRFGLSRRKAASIHGLARSLTNGDLDLPAIAGMTDDRAIAELVKFNGIGPWTAEMFLLFGLRRLDTVSYRDAGLRRGIQRAYGLPHRPSDGELERLFDNWRPFRGVGCWYMWRVAG